MSSTGTPHIDDDELNQIKAAARDLKLSAAVVASRWHDTVMGGLIAGAERLLLDLDLDNYSLLRAPGSFELPVITSHAVHHFDVVIALGVVIRGGTPHFDYVCSATTEGLSQIAVQTGKPIGFGLLTCDTEEQALDRAGLEGSREDKGFEAAHAAVAAALEIAKLDA